MLIIGEKLNSSVPAAQQAFIDRDADYFKNIALKQTACGADYLDVNAGVFTDETDKLLWAVEQVTSVCKTPLVIDSANPKAAKAVFERFELQKPIINSITPDEDRFSGMIELVKRYETGIIALPLGKSGMPKDAQERIDNARAMIARLCENGVPEDRIYIDLIVETLSVEYGAAKCALDATLAIHREFPEIHLVGGMSNVSFGLPKRMYINAAFLTAAMVCGLDSAILDITNANTKMALLSSQLVLGEDEYCMNYLGGYRDLFID